MDTRERLNYIIENEKTNRTKFAEELEYNYSSLDNIARGRVKKFPLDLADLVSKKYGYSKEWLLAGEGEPKKETIPLQNEHIKRISELLKANPENIRLILDTVSKETDLMLLAAKAINKDKTALERFIKLVG